MVQTYTLLNKTKSMNGKTVFDVWCVSDASEGMPNYPEYEVFDHKIGTATSLDDAVIMAKGHTKDAHPSDSIHHYRILEIPLNTVCYWRSIVEYTYSAKGDFIDSTLVSTIDEDIDEAFPGRTSNQIRFKPGDIVEVYGSGRCYLAFVTATPPTTRDVENWAGEMDYSDDCYFVCTCERHDYATDVSSLNVFKPRHKIHPNIEQKLSKAYQDYLTYPMRCKIADITACESLRNIVKEIGWNVEIKAPEYLSQSFTIELGELRGKGVNEVICIDRQKLYKHPRKVRTTLFRFAGGKAEGTGYKISLFYEETGLKHYSI